MQTQALTRIGEVLDHVNHHFETRVSASRASAPATHYTIAITREMGVPDHEIAGELGRRLSWQVYDHELLEELSARTGWPLREVEAADEHHVSTLQEWFESFLHFPGVREEAFVHRLSDLITELGVRGRCVIVGRGAGFILPPETTFRVRLVAPLADRAATIARQRGLTVKEATRLVESVDRHRREFVANHFYRDADEPRQYDLALNTSQLDQQACVQLILSGFRARRHHDVG